MGGWAIVRRIVRGETAEFVVKINRGEYDTGKASWRKRPAHMLEKVALVQAQRLAFPRDLRGLVQRGRNGGGYGHGRDNAGRAAPGVGGSARPSGEGMGADTSRGKRTTRTRWSPREQSYSSSTRTRGTRGRTA